MGSDDRSLPVDAFSQVSGAEEPFDSSEISVVGVADPYELVLPVLSGDVVEGVFDVVASFGG